MKAQMIDVELAVARGEIADSLFTTQDKNALATALIERVRGKAEEEARAVGGRLQTDTLPEFYIRRGSHVTFGGDYLLVASRWTVLVPDQFDMRRASAASR